MLITPMCHYDFQREKIICTTFTMYIIIYYPLTLVCYETFYDIFFLFCSMLKLFESQLQHILFYLDTIVQKAIQIINLLQIQNT